MPVYRRSSRSKPAPEESQYVACKCNGRTNSTAVVLYTIVSCAAPSTPIRCTISCSSIGVDPYGWGRPEISAPLMWITIARGCARNHDELSLCEARGSPRDPCPRVAPGRCSRSSLRFYRPSQAVRPHQWPPRIPRRRTHRLASPPRAVWCAVYFYTSVNEMYWKKGPIRFARIVVCSRWIVFLHALRGARVTIFRAPH